MAKGHMHIKSTENLCPSCDGMCAVIDSRKNQDGSRRRRYCCVACKHRFTTYELSPEQSKQWQTWQEKAVQL